MKKIVKEVSRLLNDLNQDKMDLFNHSLELSAITNSKVNRGAISEKVHSLTKWYDLFTEELLKTEIVRFRTLEINERTMKVLNYISVCNGIVDVFEGVNRIGALVIKNRKLRSNYLCFQKMKKLNSAHDEMYQINVKNDLSYFKHVRAVFGQHPSNLKNKVNGKLLYSFSSWTFDNHHKLWNFETDLYTQICHDADDNTFGVKFHLIYEELENFTKRVLKEIKIVVLEINSYIENKINSQQTIITGWSKMSRNKKIDLLLNEIDNKYYFKECHYLDSSVREMCNMLEFVVVNGFEEETNEYISLIDSSLEEIRIIVEKGSQEELVISSEFTSNIYDAIGHSYYAEKFSMYELGHTDYRDMFVTVMASAHKILGIVMSNNNPMYILFLLYKRKRVAVEKNTEIIF